MQRSTVAIGEWNTETDPDCGDMFCANPVQVMPISHVVVHPGYDKKIYRHDIALIVIKEEMKYTCEFFADSIVVFCIENLGVPLLNSF